MTEPNIVCWTYGHDYKWRCDGDENWTECRLCGEIGSRWTSLGYILEPTTDARNVIAPQSEMHSVSFPNAFLARFPNPKPQTVTE